TPLATPSLHDALPISPQPNARPSGAKIPPMETAFTGPKNCSRINPATIAARTAVRSPHRMTSNISGMGARRMPTNGATSPTIAATALSAARMAPSVSPRAGRSAAPGAAAGRTVEERAVDLLRRLVSGVGKQGELARAFDRDRQHPLVPGAVSRHPARQDLAPLGDKPAQPGNVFVVDKRGLLSAKRTDLALRTPPVIATRPRVLVPAF